MRKHSADDGTNVGSAHRQLLALTTMTVSQLAERHMELYGERTRSRNKEYLRKRLAWRIQELAEGGLSARSLAKIIELGDEVPARWRARSSVPLEPPAAASPRDPRLPPVGTVLRRTHGGRQHEVVVGESDFIYAGRPYRSLSAIARDITGTAWNGLAFFGLTTKTRAA